MSATPTEPSNRPVNLSEARAYATGEPSHWRPKDMLESLLRRIESGEISPQHMIISYAAVDADGSCSVNFCQAGTFNGLAQLGMLTSAVHAINHSSGG